MPDTETRQCPDCNGTGELGIELMYGNDISLGKVSCPYCGGTGNPPPFKETQAIRQEPVDGVPFGATWLVSAPWAHLAWNDYGVFLCDLDTPTATPVTKYREDVTHEVTVWALNPDGEHKTGPNPKDWSLDMLQPANHGYQFAARSNDEAFDRIAGLVKAIENRQLSPDTDFRSTWDELFRDGVTSGGNA